MDPIGLDSSVTTTHALTDVTAGSYSVSVMAENEYGTSQDVTATFVVQGVSAERWCAMWTCTFNTIWHYMHTVGVV